MICILQSARYFDLCQLLSHRRYLGDGDDTAIHVRDGYVERRVDAEYTGSVLCMSLENIRVDVE